MQPSAPPTVNDVIRHGRDFGNRSRIGPSITFTTSDRRAAALPDLHCRRSAATHLAVVRLDQPGQSLPSDSQLRDIVSIER